MMKNEEGIMNIGVLLIIIIVELFAFPIKGLTRSLTTFVARELFWDSSKRAQC
jgi:hypothetical protein